MKDPRLDQLAQIILSHSIKMQPAEIVSLVSDVTAMPLAAAIVKQANRMGVFCHVELASQELTRLIAWQKSFKIQATKSSTIRWRTVYGWQRHWSQPILSEKN